MAYEELKSLANVVVPLIKAGQSPYQVITNHPELNILEKTLYNYIEDGVFREFGLLDVDLRIKTKRRITKKASNKYKKREDRKYLKGRTYDDFINYVNENDNPALSKWIPSIITVLPIPLCKHLNFGLTLSCLLYTMKKKHQRPC